DRSSSQGDLVEPPPYPEAFLRLPPCDDRGLALPRHLPPRRSLCRQRRHARDRDGGHPPSPPDPTPACDRAIVSRPFRGTRPTRRRPPPPPAECHGGHRRPFVGLDRPRVPPLPL